MRRVIVNSLARIMAITTLIACTTSIIRTRYTEIISGFIGLREVMREREMILYCKNAEERTEGWDGGIDD